MLSMTSNLSTKFCAQTFTLSKKRHRNGSGSHKMFKEQSLWTSDPFFRSCSQVLGLNHIPYSLGVIAGQESPEASPSSSPTIPLTSVEANNTNNPVLTKDAVQQLQEKIQSQKKDQKDAKKASKAIEKAGRCISYVFHKSCFVCN